MRWSKFFRPRSQRRTSEDGLRRGRGELERGTHRAAHSSAVNSLLAYFFVGKPGPVTKMFTEQTMKITDRVRRLLWRGQTFSYRVWVGSTVVSMFAFKSFVVAIGPKDTRAFGQRGGCGAGRRNVHSTTGCQDAANFTTSPSSFHCRRGAHGRKRDVRKPQVRRDERQPHLQVILPASAWAAVGSPLQTLFVRPTQAAGERGWWAPP